ncbi:MAG: ferritin family protein [Armatimonadota bacterium]|nr:ferritin family protein [Armatimonadota bacterium]
MADVCEVMQEAIEMERDAQRFYTKAASEATNPLAKRTFEALSEWEVEHEKLLRDVFEKARATDSCPALGELEPKQVDMMQQAEQIFMTALEDVGDTLANDPTLEGAYATAMDKERRAIRFYGQHLEEAEGENERMLYEFLLGQERGHLNLLATTEEYLNDTQYWHFKEEMWMATG